MRTYEDPTARRQRQDLISAVLATLRGEGDTDRDLEHAVALIVDQAIKDGITDEGGIAEIVREATRDAEAEAAHEIQLQAEDKRRAR